MNNNKEGNNSSVDYNWSLLVLGGIWFIIVQDLFWVGIGFMVGGFGTLLIKVGSAQASSELETIGKTTYFLAVIIMALEWFL